MEGKERLQGRWLSGRRDAWMNVLLCIWCGKVRWKNSEWDEGVVTQQPTT